MEITIKRIDPVDRTRSKSNFFISECHSLFHMASNCFNYKDWCSSACLVYEWHSLVKTRWFDTINITPSKL